MTNQRRYPNRPTKPQIKLLKDLALETGQSFDWPTTFEGARAQIKLLLASKKTPSFERRHEARTMDEDFAGGFRDATSIRDDELTGYGSSAGWA